jgi:GNAT superfamily N-acetyltransferase
MIRSAVLDDFEEIVNIKKLLALNIKRLDDDSYKLDIEKNGFLIPSEYTEEEFFTDLTKVFFVNEDHGKINAFIRIDDVQELRKATETDWIKHDLKEIYFSFPHACIGGIAVLPERAHSGIASQMLTAAEREIKSRGYKYLFSSVTSAPIKNYPSIRFHEKNKFEQIAITKPHVLFGIENYQSILFAKAPSL